VKQAIKRLGQGALAPLAPLRWRLQSQPSLLVLMYHRVLPLDHPDRAIEQAGMYVAPQTLDMHLRLLNRHMEIVHLDEWVRNSMAGVRLPRLACAITFDDGWQDNFEHAFPVLQRNGAPATIFLVSGMIGTSREFWPNRLARLLSQLRAGTSLPERLAAVLSPVLGTMRARDGWALEDLDRAVVLAKQLPEPELEELLVAAHAAAPSARQRRAVLNEAELHAMAASGLIRFGSHTRNHLRFRGELAPEILEREIAGSRDDIAACVGEAAVGLFCYPNGDTTPTAIDLVRRHYLAAVTTRRGWHHGGSDRFLMRRVGVHEDISSHPQGFLARLSGWS
jgi:peptidoglycan/xylan/chitin deacetylase (PgdA/CDA1 family)